MVSRLVASIIYLICVSSQLLHPSDLQRSVWNTQSWTYWQEYAAAETTQFHTEDRRPYLRLTLFNHKESPAIILGTEQMSSVSAKELAVLCSGLARVREKLFLASTRQTTLIEDIACSLLGIFNAAIPILYSDGDRAVGRILTGSGDVTILAWTGTAAACLPVDLTVYSKPVAPHVRPLIETAQLDGIVTESRSSLSDISPVMQLYDRPRELPSPSMAASLRLPGIVSGPDPETHLHVCRAATTTEALRLVASLQPFRELSPCHAWSMVKSHEDVCWLT